MRCEKKRLALVCTWLALAAASSAARIEQQVKQLEDGPAGDASRALNTYYFDVSEPVIALSPHGSGRAGRTALTVTLSEASISRYMPVVAPKSSGMTHAVTNTWSALKGLATMFSHVTAINHINPSGPRLFPRSAVALTAANDNTPIKLDVSSVIKVAERRGHRDYWTETTPGSLLLLPVGQSTGAVADLLDVSYDAQADTVTLEVDLVHDPHTVSEFEHHGKQTLDVDQAHYHFLTGPGVKVDAQALIKSLQDTQFAVEGLHAFVKGVGPTCFGVTLTTFSPVAPVNSIVNVTITLDGSNCPSLGKTEAAISSIPPGAVDGASIQLSYLGPVEWLERSYCTSCENGEGSKTSQKPARRGDCSYYNAYTNDAVAWATFRVTAEGGIAIGAVQVEWDTGNGYFPIGTGNLFLNTGGGQCSGAVSKLVVMPQKVYRHVHDTITLTVKALDANGVAVSGAEVSLAANGDCKPVTQTGSVITGAAGTASFLITADEPGAVSVVAAALDTNGAPVTSAPAHIIFFEDHHYIDHREKDYYAGDAERFAAAAAKTAVQQASAKRVSKTN